MIPAGTRTVPLLVSDSELVGQASSVSVAAYSHMSEVATAHRNGRGAVESISVVAYSGSSWVGVVVHYE